MKSWRKLALLASFLGAGLGLFNNANAQTKRIRVVDPILYKVDALKNNAGIPNLKVNLNGSNFITNDSGYVDLVTNVEFIRNNDFLNINLKDNNLFFNYNGQASLRIYDLLGKEVKHFDNMYENLRYDFTNNFNQRISNGIYFYVLDKKDKIETGAFMTLFNQDNVEVYLKNRNKDRKASKSSGLNKPSNLESYLTLSIKDEDIPSTDGIHDLGEYFDIDAEYPDLNSIPEIINMIPVLPFTSPYYRNILHFTKYITISDGTNNSNHLVRWYNKDLPIKLFYNKATAPNPYYIAAVDSAISPLSINSWESMTSFNYKGYVLPKMDLFTESSSNPDTGAKMDYSTDWSHYIMLWYPPIPEVIGNPPYYAWVYVANNIGDNWYRISSETKHELAHILFTTPRHSTDTNHNIQSGQYITKDEGNTVRIIYSLPNIYDMRIYKED